MNRELINKRTILRIILIATVAFLAGNIFLGGYMFDKQLMGAQIMTEPHLLDEYNISDLPPFKYRILFAWIVQGTYEILGGDSNELFFRTFIAWSYIFFITASVAIFSLLRTLRFSKTLSWLGLILFLLSPAVIMGFTPPVHTREDFLAYTFLAVGLIFLVRGKMVPFMIVSIVAITCRETMLILPFTMLFFTRYYNFVKRATLAVVPFLAWIGFRFLLGYEQYDIAEGLQYNLKNYLQIPAFFFITFSALWVIFLYSSFKSKVPNASSDMRRTIISSAPWAVLLIVLTTFFGGIFNEIRLLHLAFPWIIVANLVYLERYRSMILGQMRQPLYIGLVSFLAVLTISSGYYIIAEYGHMLTFTRYAVPAKLWIIAGLVTFFVFSAWLPIALSIMLTDNRNASLQRKTIGSGMDRLNSHLELQPSQQREKEYIH